MSGSTNSAVRAISLLGHLDLSEAAINKQLGSCMLMLSFDAKNNNAFAISSRCPNCPMSTGQPNTREAAMG